MENAAYRTARRHVERKLGFFIHFGVFAAVNTGLMLANLLYHPARLWAFWPLLGWGIGLSFHGLAVLLNAPGMNWKQRMIEKEMRAIENHHREG